MNGSFHLLHNGIITMNSIAKACLFCVVLAPFSSALAAQYTNDEKEMMYQVIQRDLKVEIKDPALQECWVAATQEGDTTALSSLYVVARALPLMKEVGRQTEEILAGGERQVSNLNALYSSPSLTKHLGLIKAYTPALMYCNGRSQAKNPDALKSLGETGERYGAPQTQQYIEMMR